MFQVNWHGKLEMQIYVIDDKRPSRYLDINNLSSTTEKNKTKTTEWCDNFSHE